MTANECQRDTGVSELPRRQFLATAVVSVPFLRSCQSMLAATHEGQPRVVVGGHPWIYAATRPDRDITPVLPRIFADMKYAGMGGIELMHTALRPNDAVDRIAELSRKYQLPIIGMSFGGTMWNRDRHQAVFDDAALTVPRLARLGGRTLGTSVGPLKGGQKIRKTAEQLDAQAELVHKLMTLCAPHGVVLNLHNHTYEVENELHDLLGTLGRVPEVKLGPDVNWLIRGGVDPAMFIRRHARRIVFLHLRDQSKDGRWSEALGEGATDFSAIADALREIDFRGHVVIELAHERDFKPTRPLRDSLKLSREFVRRTLGY